MSYGNPNLLPVDASTFEGGTTSWAAGNSDVTVSVANTYWTGSYGLSITPQVAASEHFAFGPFVPVDEGKPYVAYVPVSGDTGSTGISVDIAVAWYDANSSFFQYSPLVTQTLTDGFGFYYANIPVLCADAPAGAAYGRVRLRVYGLTVGYEAYVDDVYFGVAPELPGNLLPYNAQGMETDVSAWALTNGTAERLHGYLEDGSGSYLMSGTATAAGRVDVRTVDSFAVTPGVEYSAYCIGELTTSGSTAGFDIEWLDDSGALIGTATSDGARDVDVVFRAVTVAVAPDAAASCRLVFHFDALAAGDGFYFDQAGIWVATNPAGNLLTYNEYSFESLVPPQIAVNATVSQGALYGDIVNGYFGMALTPVSPDLLSAELERLVPVTAGETYLVSALIFGQNSTTTDTEYLVRARIRWYNGDGQEVPGNTDDQFYPQTVVPNSLAGTQVSTVSECPPGAIYARPMVEIDATNSACDWYIVDSVKLMVSEPEYTLEVRNTDGVIVLTVDYEPDPGLYPTVDGISVWRMDADGAKTPVRAYGQDAVNLPWPGAPLVLEDYEAPLGTSVWYYIVWLASGAEVGAHLFTRMVAAPILADGDYVWLKSPGIPALNTRVMMETPPAWSRGARSATYNVVGRARPVQVSALRTSRSGGLSVLVWAADDNDTFNRLLDAGTPLLLQSMPGYGQAGNLFLHVGDSSEEPLSADARNPARRWSLDVIEVDRPAGGISGSALRTWADVESAFDRWGDVLDAFDTWADVLTGEGA